MKKLFAILMTLCLLCAAGASTADIEIPDFDSMPAPVIETDDTVIEESAFEGEWVLNVAFAGAEYLTEQELSEKFDYNFMPYVIGEGKICQDLQNEYGEFVTVEMPYIFESGMLQGHDAEDRVFSVQLLEDGNILLTVYYPEEGNVFLCLSVYLKHPEED